MALFRPTRLAGSVTDLTPALFQELGVTALLLDVDNTIASFTSHEPMEGAVAWARSMTEAGLSLIIVSNNYKRRVSTFAAKFGLDFISFACKPFPFGYIRAKRRLGVKARQCAIVGDQIFTDVTGANLCGMRSVLLRPIELEAGWSFRIRRYFERPLRARYASTVNSVEKG